MPEKCRLYLEVNFKMSRYPTAQQDDPGHVDAVYWRGHRDALAEPRFTNLDAPQAYMSDRLQAYEELPWNP